jgi:sigma-B regulation protein RsbU (phosphoserine phosphatase)
MKETIVPERFKDEYKNELKRIFSQRINLFCYIAIGVFSLEFILAWFFFRRLLSAEDMPGILGGIFFSLVLLATGKFSKRLIAQKVRGMFFSFLVISIAILAAAAHPDVIANLGITLILIAFFLSTLLLPWNMIEAAAVGIYTLVTFAGVYQMANTYVNVEIFGINITLLIVATLICLIVKRSEGIMRQKDFVLRKEVEEKSKMLMEELELANKIHSGLMPKSLSTKLVDVAVNYRPMLYMGGDYAKFHFLSRDRLFFMISDITGHGVSAALLVNRIHTETENLIRENLMPGEVLRRLDNFIKSDFGKMGIFLSGFCGILDFSSKKLVYSNYGHPPQILFQKAGKRIVFMEPQTFLMGIGMETSDVYQVKLRFERGDRIFLFTDGLVESKNPVGEEFGYERLKAFISEKSESDVAHLNEELMAALKDFQAGEQGDDIFLLAIQIK